MHQSLQGATFHVEHVVSRAVGGSDDELNLCLACPSCNLHKLSRVSAVDPITGEVTSLFHPRVQIWSEHFAWIGLEMSGLSAEGRATIEALHMNSPRRILIRQAESMFDLFPPTE
jgi:HNH endonuclease